MKPKSIIIFFGMMLTGYLIGAMFQGLNTRTWDTTATIIYLFWFVLSGLVCLAINTD